jgi:hypothetical protein
VTRTSENLFVVGPQGGWCSWLLLQRAANLLFRCGWLAEENYTLVLFGCTKGYLVLNKSGYKLVHPGMQKVLFAFVHPLYTLARGHNVFVLSNSRDHRFTFKNERKIFLLPSIYLYFHLIS